MRSALCMLAFICTAFAVAQPPRMELTPAGFAPITVNFPDTLPEKLVDLTNNWAYEYNLRQGGHDATNVTGNTITITANRENAFYYRERGEAFDHEIRYEMHFTFNQGSYTLKFTVVDIYSRDKLLEYNIPNYFTSEGRLKEGYEELEPSLETTVNNIVRSHYNYMINYR